MNKNLITTRNAAPKTKGKIVLNKAGGKAYLKSDKEALAAYCATATFNNTFYATGKENLDLVKGLLDKVDAKFAAQCAVYSRKNARMKDIPAYILAYLAAKGEVDLLKSIFPVVVDNVKILLNFVQVIRSGVTGRKSFGTAVKRLINDWLNSKNAQQLFNASIGHSNPSFSDVVKMTHPKANSKEVNNMLAYLLDKKYEFSLLPPEVKKLELLKSREGNDVPNVPFRVLTNCSLTSEQWAEVARNMPWDTLRQNLNSIARKVDMESIKDELAKKIRNEEEILKCNVFPYQLYTTKTNLDPTIPSKIVKAVNDAMEFSTRNVPAFPGKIAVCVDVSGSMVSPVTGEGKAICRDVAAMFAAATVRRNPGTKVYAFSSGPQGLNRLDIGENVKVDEIINTINGLPSGGTDCSLPLQYINRHSEKYDLVIYFSDNQSWCGYGGNLGLMREWEKYRERNPGSKLVLVDLQATNTSQAKSNVDILNVAGFSNGVWDVINSFVNGTANFVDTIEEIEV